MRDAARDRPGPSRRALLRGAGAAALSAATLPAGPRGQRSGRARLHRLRPDRQAARPRLPGPARRRPRRPSPRSTAAGSTRPPPLMGGVGPDVRRLPPAARRPRRRRRRRLDARPLARPDDDDGLRRGQGRLRREAADPVRPRGAMDGRRRPAAQAGRPGRDAAAVGAALPEGPRADPRRPHRQGRRGPDVVLPQHHARLRLARPTATRRRDSTTTSGSAPPRSGRTTRTGRSTTSAGSGTTPAAR